MDDSLLPVTSLRENLTQTHLDFSYFRTTEPKLTPALRKIPLTSLRHTIWTGDAYHPQTSICPAFSKTYIQKKPHCRFNVTKLTLNQQCGFLSMILLQAAICHLTAFIMIELKQQILFL